ncbi:hypothetical protein JQU79_19385 [Sulfitobacter mediterraneus]|nr:hypothetical protein [Sulfitobacter mediterraneus]
MHKSVGLLHKRTLEEFAGQSRSQTPYLYGFSLISDEKQENGDLGSEID